jgi:hypothetical protein
VVGYHGGMENAETTPHVASRQRAHRSAVSNGTRLFCVDGLDGRSQTARRFRDGAHASGSKIKLCEAALEKLRSQPFGAALDFRASEGADDPLRAAALPTIALALDVPQ